MAHRSLATMAWLPAPHPALTRTGDGAIAGRESPVGRVSRTPRERSLFSCALKLDALFAVVEALRAAASLDRRFDAFFLSSSRDHILFCPSTPNAKPGRRVERSECVTPGELRS